MAEATLQKSFLLKKEAHQPEWFVVDGDNQIVGRLASAIAMVLMGKHKPTYTPHVACGDVVVVTNCERVRFSGTPARHDQIPYFTSKTDKKTYKYHTMYPGGLRKVAAEKYLKERPEVILQEAVRRMLPKNKLGSIMLKRLKLVVGGEHEYQAQQPQPFPMSLIKTVKTK
jgi:large subunit ribosomal protein L13